MAKPCSICTHPERGAIDRALCQKVPLPQICDEFGVKYGALYNHKRAGHVEEEIIKAANANYRDMAAEAMKWLDEAHDIALRGAQIAEEDRKPSVMIQYATATANLVNRVLEITDYRKLKEEVEELKAALGTKK